MNVTTAARRVTRTVNTYSPETTLVFDLDGQILDTHSTGMWYTERQDWQDQPHLEIAGRSGRESMTYVTAQEYLDEAANPLVMTPAEIAEYDAETERMAEAASR